MGRGALSFSRHSSRSRAPKDKLHKPGKDGSGVVLWERGDKAQGTARPNAEPPELPPLVTDRSWVGARTPGCRDRSSFESKVTKPRRTDSAAGRLSQVPIRRRRDPRPAPHGHPCIPLPVLANGPAPSDLPNLIVAAWRTGERPL